MESEKASEKGYSLRSLGRDFIGAVRLGYVILAIIAVLSRLPVDSLYVDLLSHFQAQYFFLLLSGLLLFSFRASRRVTLLLLCGVLSSGSMIAPLYFSDSSPCSTCEYSASAGDRITLLLANVHAQNQHYREFIDSVPTETSILGLLEIDPNWERELHVLREHFPHVRSFPDRGFFGIALYSKFPIESLEVIEHPSKVASKTLKSISAVLRTPRGTLPIVLTHPYSPQSVRGYRWRNRQLKRIAKLVRGDEDETAEKKRNRMILMGDLNTSPWSSAYANSIAESGLRDARNGFGLRATWPAHVPSLYQAILGVPIDYILLAEDYAVERISVFPIKGSDHHGLLAEVRLPSASAAAE